MVATTNYYLKCMIKPSVATVALTTISMEKVVGYDGPVLVSDDIRGL